MDCNIEKALKAIVEGHRGLGGRFCKAISVSYRKPDNPSPQLLHPFYLSRVNNPMDYVDFLIEKFFEFVGRLRCVGFAFF